MKKILYILFTIIIITSCELSLKPLEEIEYIEEKNDFSSEEFIETTTSFTNSRRPTLSVSYLDNAVSYELQVCTTGTFSNPIVNEVYSMENHDYVFGSDLTENGRYYWRVRVTFNSGEQSSWVNNSFYFQSPEVLDSFEVPGQPLGSNHDWTITYDAYVEYKKGEAYDGEHYIELGDGTTTADASITLNVDFDDDEVLVFYYKKSSGGDLIVLIDGEEIFTQSSKTDWIQQELIIPAGTSTVEFEYNKTYDSLGYTLGLDYLYFIDSEKFTGTFDLDFEDDTDYDFIDTSWSIDDSAGTDSSTSSLSSGEIEEYGEYSYANIYVDVETTSIFSFDYRFLSSYYGNDFDLYVDNINVKSFSAVTYWDDYYYALEPGKHIITLRMGRSYSSSSYDVGINIDNLKISAIQNYSSMFSDISEITVNDVTVSDESLLFYVDDMLLFNAHHYGYDEYIEYDISVSEDCMVTYLSHYTKGYLYQNLDDTGEEKLLTSEADHERRHFLILTEGDHTLRLRYDPNSSNSPTIIPQFEAVRPEETPELIDFSETELTSLFYGDWLISNTLESLVSVNHTDAKYSTVTMAIDLNERKLLSFDYRTTLQSSHYFHLYVDGESKLSVGDKDEWTNYQVVLEEGLHYITFKFYRSTNTYYSNRHIYVDNIEFIGEDSLESVLDDLANITVNETYVHDESDIFVAGDTITFVDDSAHSSNRSVEFDFTAINDCYLSFQTKQIVSYLYYSIDNGSTKSLSSGNWLNSEEYLDAGDHTIRFWYSDDEKVTLTDFMAPIVEPLDNSFDDLEYITVNSVTTHDDSDFHFVDRTIKFLDESTYNSDRYVQYNISVSEDCVLDYSTKYYYGSIGMEVDLEDSFSHSGYSNDWENYSVFLPSGDYTLQFEYNRDDVAEIRFNEVYSVQSNKLYDFEDGTIPVYLTSEWTVESGGADSSSYSLVSSAISHNESTSVEFVVEAENGALLYFDYLTSSQAGYDMFSISVNDTIEFQDSGDQVDWDSDYIELEGGIHTIELMYKKNSSYDYYDDLIKVDNIKVITY